MLTRSQKIKQHIYLKISEKNNNISQTIALRKRHHDYLYKSFKKRYRSRGKNLIII